MESPNDRILTASVSPAAAGAAERGESGYSCDEHSQPLFLSIHMIHPFLSFPSKIRRFFTCFLSFPLFLVYACSTKKSIPSGKFYNSAALFTKESYTLFIKNCSFYTKMAESEKIPPKCYFLEEREIICFLQVLRFADFVP